MEDQEFGGMFTDVQKLSVSELGAQKLVVDVNSAAYSVQSTEFHRYPVHVTRGSNV